MKTSEELEKEMERIKQLVHEAKIREGKVSIVQEVKKRILEQCPNISNIEYILWPIRVAQNEPWKPTNTRMNWKDKGVQELVQKGDWEGIIAKYGCSRNQVAQYKYCLNKKAKEADNG